MHYGGRFQWKPTIRWTGKKVKTFRAWDPDELCILNLCRMFEELNDIDKSCNITFWYCLPNVSFDKGLFGIRVEDDVNMINDLCKGMATRQIHVVAGRDPHMIVSPDGKVIYERVPQVLSLTWQDDCGDHLASNHGKEFDQSSTRDKVNAENNPSIAAKDNQQVDEVKPEWLREGIETLDDEDIFGVASFVGNREYTIFVEPQFELEEGEANEDQNGEQTSSAQHN